MKGVFVPWVIRSISVALVNDFRASSVSSKSLYRQNINSNEHIEAHGICILSLNPRRHDKYQLIVCCIVITSRIHVIDGMQEFCSSKSKLLIKTKQKRPKTNRLTKEIIWISSCKPSWNNTCARFEICFTTKQSGSRFW